MAKRGMNSITSKVWVDRYDPWKKKGDKHRAQRKLRAELKHAVPSCMSCTTATDCDMCREVK